MNTSPSLIPTSEVFGPTIQGEGPHTGRRCFFVRTGLCNLHCGWCDTPYTWDATRYDVAKECPPRSPEEIVGTLRALGATPGQVVVISGGEPLIHHPKLQRLTEQGPGFLWHVESNGTIPPPDWWAHSIAHTTLSPKVAQEDDPWRKRIKAKVLTAWAELDGQWETGVCFKFVCRNEADLEVVDSLVDSLDLPPRLVWIMPEGTTPSMVLTTQGALADAVVARGYNLSTRLHTLLWGETRGR